ncbi:MAG TPA: DUF1648 domain-containing protein [Gemmatimonadales bacterium]|nr:DUF1648 domain-containing protein [Gemmatimonadales bacterium]
MLSSGKMAFWILATGLVVVLAATFDLLPPVVASHFDAAGAPNGWSSRRVHSLVILMIGVGLPLMIVGLVRFLTRSGPEGLNIPAREYWTRPEHGGEAVRRVRAYMWWLGGVMAGTALVVHVLVLAANRSQPPHLRNDLMYLMLAAVLLVIGVWALGWYRLLRPPGQAERQASGTRHRR